MSGRVTRLGAGSFLVAILLTAWSVCAETAEDLQRVEQKLSAQKAEAVKLDKKEKEAAQEINDLRQRLVEATMALQKKQGEQDLLKDRLKGLEDEISQREESLSGAREQLGSFAKALLIFKRQPPEIFLFRDPMTEDNWHRALLLGALLPRLEKQTSMLALELEDLEKLREDAAGQKRLVTTTRQSLAEQRANLDKLIKTRQNLLQQTSAQKETLIKEMEKLADEAKDLRQLMEKVSHNSAFPKNVKPPSLLPELKLPISGRIARSYGSKDEFGVVSQGLTLTADPGSPVVAPQGGRVAFLGPFKGYGLIVVLQHGSGYHSFLAGFGRIDVDIGQNVSAGEPLGVLPEKADSPAELYFEWRHNGEPVDPVGWKETLRRP